MRVPTKNEFGMLFGIFWAMLFHRNKKWNWALRKADFGMNFPNKTKILHIIYNKLIIQYGMFYFVSKFILSFLPQLVEFFGTSTLAKLNRMPQSCSLKLGQITRKLKQFLWGFLDLYNLPTERSKQWANGTSQCTN
jgi:hypothetical protein